MKNKKKILALSALLTSALFCFGACGEEAHTHTFSDSWSSDEVNHWHTATCGHNEKGDLAAHSFSNGLCTICGYKDPDYLPPSENPGGNKEPGGDKEPGEENPGESQGGGSQGSGSEGGGSQGGGSQGGGSQGGGSQGSGSEGGGSQGGGSQGGGSQGGDSQSGGSQGGGSQGGGSQGGAEEGEGDALFGGTFTTLSSAQDRARLKEYLLKTVRRIGAGAGYAEGDLKYIADLDGSWWNVIIMGIEGDVASSQDLKVKELLRDPTVPGTGPIAYYAGDDTAYEEYDTAIVSFEVENCGKLVAQDTIDGIWYTFSITQSLFDKNIQIGYKEENGTTVIKLSYVIQNEVVGNYGSYGIRRDEITVGYAITDGKVSGLRFVTDSEYINMPSIPASHSAVTVLVGDYTFEMPAFEDVSTGEGSPMWVVEHKAFDESIFATDVHEFADAMEQSLFGSLVSNTRSRLSGGAEAAYTNRNFKLTQKTGSETEEYTFDLYNGEGMRIEYRSKEKTVRTDEEKSIFVEGESGTTGESKADEYYKFFCDTYTDKLLYMLSTYVNDIFTGEINYNVEVSYDDYFFVMKMANVDESGDVLQETTYVFDMGTGSILAIKDVTKTEDGTQQETVLICGDYTIDEV